MLGPKTAIVLKEPTQPSGLLQPTQNPEHNTKYVEHRVVVRTYLKATEWTFNKQ